MEIIVRTIMNKILKVNIQKELREFNLKVDFELKKKQDAEKA